MNEQTNEQRKKRTKNEPTNERRKDGRTNKRSNERRTKERRNNQTKNERPNKQTKEQTNEERTTEQTNEEQSNEHTNEQTKEWETNFSTHFSRSPILCSLTSQSSDNCWTFHFCSFSSSCSLFTSLSLLLRSVCCFLMSVSSLEISILWLLSSDDTWSSLLLLWTLKTTQEIGHWIVC